MGTYAVDDGTWRGNTDVLMNKDIYILGIESSCDDTSAAVLKNGVLLSNVTASQSVHEGLNSHREHISKMWCRWWIRPSNELASLRSS